MKRGIASFLAVLTVSTLIPLSGQTPRPAAAETPVPAHSEPSAGPSPGDPLPQWLPPPPDTASAVPSGLSPRAKKIASRAAFACTIGGMALAVFGISETFSSLTRGPDSGRLHRGLSFAVSGSVLAAGFSALRLILSDIRREPANPEGVPDQSGGASSD
ncbi:hypothetical protein K7J14_12225 [Treponema zuelzerae]|uniref:Uncharacterized protein n=1 Tax=Teretinema zuelzerae TaxID=156 RepID=A0AAE3EKC0_9SPIR|nr:hypothetical protein [Teretinema zuelzerae]MCD1655461.1 hypothetical protein [Teretinema zuelzerae]